MKTPRSFLAALAATVLFAGSALAADISGSWKWPMQGRGGNTTEAVGIFLLKDGVLSGTVTGRMGEAPIGDASFKEGAISFTVTREVNGEKIVMKYDGKLEGDTITGKLERPGFNEHDSAVIFEWKATRVK